MENSLRILTQEIWATLFNGPKHVWLVSDEKAGVALFRETPEIEFVLCINVPHARYCKNATEVAAFYKETAFSS